MATVVLALGVYAWETPSGDYAIWPDTAHPTAQYLLIPHGKAPAPGTGFYFVDVRIIDANLLTKFWAEHLVNGGGLLPIAEVRAPGQSNQQYNAEDLQEMATSQQIAQAVAEQALKMPVRFVSTGVVVSSVSPGLPAAKAGVQPGWVISKVNGRKVQSADGLLAITQHIRPGQVVHYVFAGHAPMALRTVADPTDRSKAIIGITIAESVRITRIPVPVKFLTQGIGGPSAGLAFALDIYDALSGRKLLRGHKIAVTGQLSLDGTVSPIGGVVQKTIGAIDAGDDTFLVPAGQNYRDALREAHGRIRIIAVTSFQQALRVIRSLKPKA